MRHAYGGGRRVGFQHGGIYHSHAGGTHVLYGAILTRWSNHGGASSWFGYPTADVSHVHGGLRGRFQHGVITWDRSSDSYQVWPPLTGRVAPRPESASPVLLQRQHVAVGIGEPRHACAVRRGPGVVLVLFQPVHPPEADTAFLAAPPRWRRGRRPTSRGRCTQRRPSPRRGSLAGACRGRRARGRAASPRARPGRARRRRTRASAGCRWSPRTPPAVRL